MRDSFVDAIIYKQLPQGTRVPGLGHASNKGIDPGVMLACHCHPSAEACWAHHLKFSQMIDGVIRGCIENWISVQETNLPFPRLSNSGISLSLVPIKADLHH
jgi:hypothetical protein